MADAASQPVTSRLLRSSPTALLAIGPAVAVVAAAIGIVGADARWLVAVGRHPGLTHLHDTVGFATASTTGWHNAPVLGELIFRALYAIAGDHGLVIAQLAASAIGMTSLVFGLRVTGARPAAVMPISLLVLVGALPAFVIVRNGLFSLALFPVLLLLLESDAVSRSRRIWLVVPLLVLWANCHGGVLVGYALLVVYLGLARRDTLASAAGVAGAGALAICATPELWETPLYYLGVSQSEAVRQGAGLWAPLSTGVLDVVLVVCAGCLILVARRAWYLWEVVAAVGLAAATIQTVRLGTWLLFLCAYPAARGARFKRPLAAPVALPAVLVLLALLLVFRSLPDTGERVLAERAARSGLPVLADAIPAEQVAAFGGKVWVSDPIDAFRSADQRAYLDWLAGRSSGVAIRNARLVLVQRTSPAGRAAARDTRLKRIASDSNGALYRVLPSG